MFENWISGCQLSNVSCGSGQMVSSLTGGMSLSRYSECHDFDRQTAFVYKCNASLDRLSAEILEKTQSTNNNAYWY